MKALFAAAIGIVLLGGGLYLTWGGNNAAHTAQDQAKEIVADLYGDTSGNDGVENTRAVATAILPVATSNNQNKTFMQATLHTNQGDITIEFMSNDAPNTVANFTKLAQSGFYDGTKFHRVIKGFMIQGGDPLTKDTTAADRWGTGGPGYTFADEIHANNKNNIGTISMANAGPNTNGSQFFINTADNNFLDGKHTVFGRVVSGMDVVKKIESVETVGPDRPIEAVVIERVTLK